MWRKKIESNEFRVGRTMAGEAPRARREALARLALKKKRQRRKSMIILIILMILALVAVIVARYVTDFIAKYQAATETKAVLAPTVEIVDENVGENVSARVEEFVARLEVDVKEGGVEVDHIVLPLGMARQLNVYVKGREEYYKLSLDRGSAVQAEDMIRMMGYLDEKGISCGYVDLRVEGKAFYQ